MISAEQRLFLRCLADLCHGRVTEQPGEEVDAEALFALADAQSMTGLVYTQCRSWLQDKRFGQAFLSDVFYSVNRASFLREIVDRFRAEGILLIAMKGAVLRELYPMPEARTMGDVDLIIRPEERERADRIMREDLGCRRLIDHQAVWIYWLEPVHLQVEIHVHMFYEYLTSGVDYEGYFDGVWERCHKAPVFGVSSEELFVPDEDFHFLYLMTHTAKHVTNHGSGYRPFLDMVLLSRADGLDWERIGRELEKLQLLEFTRTCFGLCQRWFGVEMPLKPIDPEEDFYTAATEKCFADGLFGLENEENAGAASAKELKRSTLPRWLAVLGLTVKKLFPPYKDMQLIPWYSWVDGRPWLLPAAWVYRWFYCLIHKRKAGMDLLAEPFAKKETVAAREDWLRQWGL